VTAPGSDWPPWGDGRASVFGRLLHVSTLAARHAIVGHTPFGPQYEWLVARSRNTWRWMWAEDAAPLGVALPAPVDPYEAWLAVNAWNAHAAEHLRSRLVAAKGRLPTLSVVMPVFDPEPEVLERALESVAAQFHGAWELCVADDGSRAPAVRETLERWRSRDPRVRVAWRSERGNISLATNTAASLATGEFLVFLDHDDELHPAALGEVADYLAENPAADVLYSDDDKIDRRGRRYAPQFKPSWSPELLLSHMYVSHLLVVRRRLFEALGGFREGFEGAQDHDFALRATEVARSVGHLPLVLYHWRSVPGSTATAGSAKRNGFAAGRRAVEEALARRGVAGRVARPSWAVAGDLGIFECEFPDHGPPVTVLIPTRNQPALLKKCLFSLMKTSYRDHQVVIVDNGSDEPEALRLLRAVPHRVLRIPSPNGRFNFAAIINRAVAQVGGEFLLLLNDDTEVLSPRWLSQMIGWARMPGVGAVGARLLFPDGRIQHAGVLRGVHHGLPGHAFKLWPASDNGYLSSARVPRNCSAVTAACMLTPRQLFLEMGGLDEASFGVSYNDTDYCLRLAERGYRSVYCPSAELLHREGTSRGFTDEPREAAAFRKKYPGRRDAFYSPHLSLDDAQWTIRPRRWVRGGLGGLRVLMWGQAFDLTGAPLHQLELAMALKASGFSPSVVSAADGPLRARFEEEGIPVSAWPHPLNEVRDGGLYPQAVRALSVTFRALAPDVVHANTLDCFYAVEAAHQAGIPCVWNLHESEPVERHFRDRAPWLAARARACFRLPYRLVFVSDASRAVYAELDTHGRSLVIHNALRPQDPAAAVASREQCRRSLGIVPDDLAILTVGTVCERKGQHDLVHAARRLPPEVGRRLRWFIVGDRGLPYGRELHDLVAALPACLRDTISVVPETPDTGRFYRAADVFVCSSRVESYPRVILEAMFHGLPVVSTPVFGIREQLQDSVNGLFYAPGAVEELADRIHRLVEDAELRRHLAGNARPVLEALGTFEEMAEQYGEVLREAFLAG
jgi:GT2 family glycosyltransferase